MNKEGCKGAAIKKEYFKKVIGRNLITVKLFSLIQFWTEHLVFILSSDCNNFDLKANFLLAIFCYLKVW